MPHLTIGSIIMCDGVLYDYQGQAIKTYFNNPTAVLPVKSSFDRIKLIKWGRREGEICHFPLGNTAKLDAIRHGRWDEYAPKPVKLPIRKFLEKDQRGFPRWFDIIPSYWIQGLLASDGQEYRVYIVTILPETPDANYDQWPRIMYN